MRGVFAKKEIKKGQKITRDKVFFAMPLQEGQLVSGDWFNGVKADKNYKPNAPVSETVANSTIPDDETIYRIMLQVKGMLNKARIQIGKESSVELSVSVATDGSACPAPTVGPRGSRSLGPRGSESYGESTQVSKPRSSAPSDVPVAASVVERSGGTSSIIGSDLSPGPRGYGRPVGEAGLSAGGEGLG